jgi:phage-related protein
VILDQIYDVLLYNDLEKASVTTVIMSAKYLNADNRSRSNTTLEWEQQISYMYRQTECSSQQKKSMSVVVVVVVDTLVITYCFPQQQQQLLVPVFL